MDSQYPEAIKELIKVLQESAIRRTDNVISINESWKCAAQMDGGGSLAKSRMLNRTFAVSAGKMGKRNWDKFVIKYDFSYKRDKLIREIKWIRSLPDNLARFFPEIIHYSIDEKMPFYITPYYEKYSTMNSLFLDKQLPKSYINKAIGELLTLMFEHIYPKNKSYKCKDYFKNHYIERFKRREKETTKLCKSFKELFEADKLIINGIIYDNAPVIVSKIENNKKLMKRLNPKFLNTIHGDLHLGNILFSNDHSPKFKLIDPAAFETGDYIYDLGKLYHTFNGMYDMFYFNKFKLDMWKRKKQIHAKLRIKRNKNYDYLKDNFKRIIESKNFKIISDDPDWELKALVAEAFHYITMMPFHLRNEEKAKAIYLQGVVLLNEAYSRT